MGAPNAGKSTYLAALWHSINQKDAHTKLTLKEMEYNSQYLFGLSQKWLEVEKLGRTVIGQEMPLMSVVLTSGTNEVKLEFPDLFGETFDNIYESRQLPYDIYNQIVNADAILYFINVENIRGAEIISNLPFSLRDGKEEADFIEREPAEHDPTQVQVIDLLQIIRDIKKPQINLGLILSAWDVIDNMEKVNPREYLKDNMNMLWQFIESNKNVFQTRIWGVSAQGGKIEDFERLLLIDDPIKRIKVINEEMLITNDITAIIDEMAVNIYE